MKKFLKNKLNSFSPRKKRIVFITSGILLLLILLTALETYLHGIRTSSPIASNILVFALVNINIILLMVLVLLVFRNLIKLYFERRQKTIGSKFRTKLIVAFISLSLIPSLLLFFVATSFISSSIEDWFNIKIENLLSESLEVAQSFYQNSEENALFYAKQISQFITKDKLLNEYNQELLLETIKNKQVEYNLGVVEIFTSQQEELLKIMNPRIPERSFVSPTSELVQKGMQGEEITEIHSIGKGKGDIIRGVVPIFSTWKSNEIVGVVVVNYYIPKSLTVKITNIMTTFGEYKQLNMLKAPIKLSYTLTFLMITLLIIFSASWFGFYLAQKITIPVQKLAEGTHAIAEGNLNFKIETSADDELGMLVDSFNQMTHDLRINKTKLEIANVGLQKTNIELDQKRIYMETVLENIATGVISLDKNGKVTTVNKSAETILDIKAKKVIGKHYREVFKLSQLDTIRNLIRRIQNRKQNMLETKLNLMINNRPLTLTTTITTLKDNNGNYLGLLAVFDDLTELIKAQRVAAWREVAQRIAHEIKNPLTPIQLSAQRLRKKYLENSKDFTKIFAECIDTIITQVNGLEKMIKEFSRFARMPASNPTLNDLHRIIDDTITLYKGSSKKITFEKDYDSHLPEINVDDEQMKRVFINLIENAIEALNGKGKINIKTLFDSDLQIVKIEVADNGRGIPAENKDKLFMPYFSTKKSGTGLGLAIVSQIITDHNGRIKVKDEHPKGTKFIIDLPIST